MQKEKKRKALWDHQHQGESCKSFPPNIFLGTCNAGAAPRDKSLLRESFRIPDEVSVTATTVTNSPLQWEASACSGAGPRKSRPTAPGGKGQQQGLHKGERYPPEESDGAARGQQPEKRAFPRCNPADPQLLRGPSCLVCPLCKVISICHLKGTTLLLKYSSKRQEILGKRRR